MRFAEDEEEEWCEGGNASGDDAEGDFDAGPELGQGRRVCGKMSIGKW